MGGPGSLGIMIPQTPKINLPSLDPNKINLDDNDDGERMAPLSVTHKASQAIQGTMRTLFLQSPQNANKPTNKLIEAAKPERKEDDTMKRVLPEEELNDFLNKYDETAWYKKDKISLKKPAIMDTGITDEIKEVDEDRDSQDSD